MSKETKTPKGYTQGYKQEQLSEVPVALPIGYKRPDTLKDIMNRLRCEMIQEGLDREVETFEEADDFDCDDDFDPSSPWEELFDPNGQSIGFLDQNKYTKPNLYERRLDERENYQIDKRDSGSGESVPTGSDSGRSE